MKRILGRYKLFFKQHRMDSVLVITLLCTVLISSISFACSNWNYLFFLQSHFQLQYALIILFLAILLFFVRQVIIGLAALTYIFALYSHVLHPIEFFPQSIPEDDIYFINMFGKELDYPEDIVDDILTRNPDIVTFAEATDSVIATLRNVYGNPHVSDKQDHFYCAIFSYEKPLTAYTLDYLNAPLCIAEYDSFTLVVLHTYSPTSYGKWHLQNEYLTQVNAILTTLENDAKPFMLVGDFNSSNYAKPFRSYFGAYVQKNIYTWHTRRPYTLPLDHVITNLDIQYHRTEKFSSDHAGLVIDIL